VTVERINVLVAQLRHLKKVAEVGAWKARIHRVILSGMMGLAVRHDAITQNPVREVARIHQQREKPRAADIETLTALREQLRVWQSGAKIDGTPAYVSGPKRSRMILHIADVLLALACAQAKCSRFGGVI
jgi:3-deoxy-D-arabino-heptulosonate 7-phosphate (DAHP) synthase class II